MIVLAEAVHQMAPSASLRDLASAVEMARLAGCRIYEIPPDFARCGDADGALAHVPAHSAETPAVWIGFIPSPERYTAIYQAALNKRVRLLNHPTEHLRGQEFDQAYPHLEGITPASRVLTDSSEAAHAAQELGLPLFVKGTVQSRKSRGWRACVAETESHLEVLVRQLLELEQRTRGRVIVREMLRLRHSRTSPEGFPFGREYRVFVYRRQVLASGYYWEGDDPLRTLTPHEESAVLSLALEAGRRLDVPYLAVDVGQAEDGRWWVIETGDAQFSGISQASPFALWNRLQAAVKEAARSNR